MNTPTRTVHQTDAVCWLREHALPADAAIATSLPNVDEFKHRDAARWRDWFVDAAELVLRCTPRRTACVFFQTDVKLDGIWIDKSFLLQQAAARAEVPLIWHKAVLRAPAGVTTNERPGYAHLLCFSPELRNAAANATPDVLPQLGAMTWPRAIGEDAARFAVAWLKEHANATAIVDPFCGVGTLLAVANDCGLDAIGIERNAGRAAKARALRL